MKQCCPMQCSACRAQVLCSLLQNNASKLLLAIMESRHDSENAEKILYKMRPNELVRVWLLVMSWVVCFGLVYFLIYQT